MLKPTIGVLGFKTSEEVRAALHAFDSLPASSTGNLLIGVMANERTLTGKEATWPARYPAIEEIASLFPLESRVLNLIHYSTDELDTLAHQLGQLIGYGGHYLDGIQLNVPWPDPKHLTPFKSRCVVLVLSGEALRRADDNPTRVAELLDRYDGLIKDVVLNGSTSIGVRFDLDLVRGYVEAIRSRHPKLGIGVDGDFSAQSVGEVEPLVRHFPSLGLQACSRLRTPCDERIDLQAMHTYIVAADKQHRKSKALQF